MKLEREDLVEFEDGRRSEGPWKLGKSFQLQSDMGSATQTHTLPFYSRTHGQQNPFAPSLQSRPQEDSGARPCRKPYLRIRRHPRVHRRHLAGKTSATVRSFPQSHRSLLDQIH